MVSDKTISIKRTLTSSPSLPFDLIPEILSRLPVKSLLQLRCVCKSWKSLISDPKFAKKHLTLSTTHTLHCISNFHNGSILLKSYSVDFVLTNLSRTQFPSSHRYVFFVGSCNGILLLVSNRIDLVQLQLWNPSIRKFKNLPPISKPPKFVAMYGFGYDPISDNYKVVVVSRDLTRDDFNKNELQVHTLGTDSWKSVSEFPFNIFYAQPLGQYVSDTINWLVFIGIKGFIASFDLGNESSREVLLPDDPFMVDKRYKSVLSVFRDCLCMISGEDVWVLKEYGNKESWTKLFTISYMRDPRASSYSYIKAINFLEDEQVCLMYTQYANARRGHTSYNYKNDTSKFIELEHFPEVCVESLISPYF